MWRMGERSGFLKRSLPAFYLLVWKSIAFGLDKSSTSCVVYVPLSSVTPYIKSIRIKSGGRWASYMQNCNSTERHLEAKETVSIHFAALYNIHELFWDNFEFNVQLYNQSERVGV